MDRNVVRREDGSAIETINSGWWIGAQAFFATDHLIRRKRLLFRSNYRFFGEERNIFVIFGQQLLLVFRLYDTDNIHLTRLDAIEVFPKL